LGVLRLFSTGILVSLSLLLLLLLQEWTNEGSELLVLARFTSQRGQRHDLCILFTDGLFHELLDISDILKGLFVLLLV
jgi:hypothetical protein